MRTRARATLACLAVALGATAAGATAAAAAAAAAGSERMQLHCESGSLAGHTLERSNGSSWWGVDDGTVYTTKSITVSGDEGVVYHRDYGKKDKAPGTCTATHFGWTWQLEVVRTGA